MVETRPGVTSLRARIAEIETGRRGDRPALGFGIPALDEVLPGGGLVHGTVHEIAGGAEGAVDGAAAALFAAGIMARTSGPILWCLTRPDLFAPALDLVGLHPDRVIYVEANDEASVLACVEEGLRHGGLGGVVGEVAKLSMVASRRLQLAAETSGTLGLAVRRWRRMSDAADFGQPTAAMTRWRVSPLSSSPLPVSGIGRPRWRVELIRARGAEPAEFIVESCDAKGRLALPVELEDRSLASPSRRRRAAA